MPSRCSGCWFCKRSTICRTSRWNIRCATGCRSRAFWGSRSRTAFRIPRRFVCSARSWPKAGLVEKLFDCFDQHLAAKGYMARGGQIIDASIVPVPTQRNSRDENAELQAGRTPAAWKQKPAKVRQKDRDARWTKKHGRSFFGYKNHVNADAKHKLIRHYAVTDAAVHDSQELDGLLDTGNTCNDVFADSAYRSAEIEAKLRASAYNSRIHRRGRRNHPLSLAQVRANHAKSRIRARIEHVFGAQQNAPGGRIVRTIGIVRARAKIGLQNLAYNIRRLVTLERIVTA